MKKILMLSLALLGTANVQSKSVKTHVTDLHASRTILKKLNLEHHAHTAQKIIISAHSVIPSYIIKNLVKNPINAKDKFFGYKNKGYKDKDLS